MNGERPGRWLVLLLTAPFATGCAALSYPDATSEVTAQPPARPTLLAVGDHTLAERPGTSGGDPSDTVLAVESLADSATGDWVEPSRRGREALARGRLDEARTAFELAESRLTDRAPGHAARRAVHGMLARTATAMLATAARGDAGALAERLLAQAEETPAIAGDATSQLAQRLAAHRLQRADAAGAETSTLPLLAIALGVEESGAPSRKRRELAVRVARDAHDAGDHALALRAIVLALADTRAIEPGHTRMLVGLELERARIAIAGGALAEAEGAAATALELIDAGDADPVQRLVGESTMGRVVARRGDVARAEAIAAGVRARLTGEEPIPPYASRWGWGDLARIEATLGRSEAARALFDRALAIPGLDLDLDRQLVAELAAERAALEPTSVPATDPVAGDADASDRATTIDGDRWR